MEAGRDQQQRELADALFDELTTYFLDRAGVERAPMFSSDGLKVNGKFFTFVASDGRLVVKVPEARAIALKTAGDATPVSPGRRTMREWIGVPVPDPPSVTGWLTMGEEAYSYVERLTRTSA